MTTGFMQGNVMHISRIKLSHIDFSDDTYDLIPSCCPSAIPNSLIKSISRVGILHLPIVKELTPTSFAIVAGKKRLFARQQAGDATSCDCFKLTDKTGPIETLAIVLEEALLCRSLTPIEEATFFRKALQWIDEKELAERFLPMMGLTPSPYHIQKGLKLLELEEPLVIAVHESSLDEKVAFELGKLPFSDRLSLFSVIETLKLSVGNQKKLTIICRELAERRNMTIFQFLSDEEIDAIVNHPEANVPQKTAKLMTWLNEKRFPRLNETEQNFREFVSSMQMPDHARLDHSPSFEKDTLLLTLSCADRKHFQAVWEQIKGLFTKTDNTEKPQ